MAHKTRRKHEIICCDDVINIQKFNLRTCEQILIHKRIVNDTWIKLKFLIISNDEERNKKNCLTVFLTFLINCFNSSCRIFRSLGSDHLKISRPLVQSPFSTQFTSDELITVKVFVYSTANRRIDRHIFLISYLKMLRFEK